ncbi:YifB family Mg chelatase-like AAA ATPase [Corynebacterium xerosis]|uniref:YifB family Mg chelatase-like AAA ATPase n=1 Tax=Corynebacterium xerosis TaxID=1725 RepID=UPI0036543163
MSVGRAASVALQGLDGVLVEVEADVGRGLPGMHIGGLGDAAVAEARDRVRTAAVNSGLTWPRTKIVVSMSPASLRKHGSAFDLAIVCAVLSAGLDDADEARGRLEHTVLLGEVGLDGTVRPVQGILPAVIAARDAGLRWAVVPTANVAEAALVDGIAVGGVSSLAQLWRWALTGGGVDEPDGTRRDTETREMPDMRDIHGQDAARRALEVVAAGGHHLFLSGPPGTGKSMLAARLPGILPPLGTAEALDVTAVHSVAGTAEGAAAGLITQPPFVAPHHTVSAAALLGGGSGMPRPGAMSLAHGGVLFLDEVTLMPARVLDALRTPLEQGEVVLLRSRHQVRYPCRVQLVMAANPCPCGAAEPGDCICPPGARRRHMAAVSGPLRDRIDVQLPIHPRHSMVRPEPGEESASIRERVIAARERGRARWEKLGIAGVTANSDVPGPVLRRRAPADDAGMAYLECRLAERTVTQRGVDRALRVAWTLADLDGRDLPTLEDVASACDLHAAADGEVAA